MYHSNKYIIETPMWFSGFYNKGCLLLTTKRWVFVFPSPGLWPYTLVPAPTLTMEHGPNLHLTALVLNFYLTVAALHLHLPAPIINFCLTVLRFAVKSCHATVFTYSNSVPTCMYSLPKYK